MSIRMASAARTRRSTVAPGRSGAIRAGHSGDGEGGSASGRPFRLALVAGLISLTAAGPVSARITTLLIDDRRTLAPEEGMPAYEELRGRLIGAVDPGDPRNRIIQDLDLAPRDAQGMVAYVTTFTLLRPIDPARGNRVLLDELPNRGRRLTPFGSDTQARRFLRTRGYTVLWAGWQGDLAERPSDARSSRTLALESLAAPVVRNRDGSSITGPYLVRLPSAGAIGPSGRFMKLDQGNAGRLFYFPARYDNRDARLTAGAPERADGTASGPRAPIPNSDWQWWNCDADAPPETATAPGDLCIRRLRGSFDPAQNYLLTFTARDPMVLGIGLAAARDAASFFRYATHDDAGTANPTAGTIDRAILQGVSQVGNFVKTLISLGFTEDEQRRRIWDGANPHIAGRLTPINFRFSTPGSSPTLFMPGSEGTLWWGTARDTVRGGVPTSLMDRCRAGRTCPRVFETFGGSELWNQRMTSGLVTADLRRDIRLPSDVRRYFFPGTTHGGGDGAFSIADADRGVCLLPPNPNPEDAQMRALLVALTDWIVKDAEPPASRYPTLSGGTLVRNDGTALEPLPWRDAPSARNLANPVLVYDYGPRFRNRDVSGIIDAMPPRILTTIPALVPRIDADGNERGGIPSVQMQAPLGTYLSWNIYRTTPYAGQICSFNGGFKPFETTAARRAAAGDGRMSLEERYRDRAGYVAAVERAAGAAVSARFLLLEDGESIVRDARAAAQRGDLGLPR